MTALPPPLPPGLPTPTAEGDTWRTPGRLGLSTAIKAVLGLLTAFVLTFAGAVCIPTAPWNAIALPAGLALACRWRFGVWALSGVLFGHWLGLMGLGWTLLTALLATGGLLVTTWAAHAALVQWRFDARLERDTDVAALALAAVALLALPLAAAGASWSVWVREGPASLGDLLLQGWLVLSLGTLVAAVAVLAFDRSLLHALHRGTAWRQLGIGAVALMLVPLVLLAAAHQPLPFALIALFGLPVVVTLLALQGQLALGAGLLIVSGLSASVAGGSGLSPWGLHTETGATIAAWIGASLGLMLLIYAQTVEWRSRNERWMWALDGAGLGVADWHLETGVAFASEGWRSMTSHVHKAWSPDAWINRLHPEDAEAARRAIESLAKGDVGRQVLEVRLPVEQGWRWHEVVAMVIERDANNHPLRLLATLSDVHGRRSVQERQRLTVSLFQHLHEGLLITDAEHRVLDANPAYSEILGVSREDILGTVPSLLRAAPADPHARQQRAAMWTALREQGSWRGELLETRADGEVRALQTTISTVGGPADDLRYHVLVISDISEQRAQREQLERQAHYDELTRLPNRARLAHLMDEAIEAADRHGHLLAVCYLDLDHFKPVNDRYGHAAGDGLLAELAGRLRRVLRSRKNWVDTAARLGGDEFVLLLNADSLDEARQAIRRILNVVSEPYVVQPGGDSVTVRASLGATIYPLDRNDADTLLRHADHAMYEAKQRGRNGFVLFDAETRRLAEEHTKFLSRFKSALQLQELVLYYQPKVDMATGEVLGFEALLRWDHPDMGILAPGMFLHAIEQNKELVVEVGDWVMAQALDHLAGWLQAGFNFTLSVNVSARHLQNVNFVQRIKDQLGRHQRAGVESIGRHLEIELLESAVDQTIDERSLHALEECRDLGLRIALDDFGTGHSNLHKLKRMPVDVLKIDGSFVHQMLDAAEDRAIVENVIGLARIFDCTVVAEGVETTAQARALLEMGCRIGQGIGIAAPMPSAQVGPWVREYRGLFPVGDAGSGHASGVTHH